MDHPAQDPRLWFRFLPALRHSKAAWSLGLRSYYSKPLGRCPRKKLQVSAGAGIFDRTVLTPGINDTAAGKKIGRSRERESFDVEEQAEQALWSVRRSCSHQPNRIKNFHDNDEKHSFSSLPPDSRDDTDLGIMCMLSSLDRAGAGVHRGFFEHGRPGPGPGFTKASWLAPLRPPDFSGNPGLQNFNPWCSACPQFLSHTLCIRISTQN